MGESEWLDAVLGNRVRSRPRREDARAIVFAAAVWTALNSWNHPETVPTARVTSFISARTLLAERIGTTDALLRDFTQGKRQIDKTRFEKTMQVELFGKPIACYIPSYLLPYVALAGVIPNGIDIFAMSSSPGERIMDADSDVKSALDHVEQLAQFLADAQKRGRLRQYAGADWQQVLDTMRPAKSRREVVRRALTDRKVLTNAEAKEILLASGMPATTLQVAQTLSSLKSHGIAETVRHGVHRLAGSSAQPFRPVPTQPGGGMLAEPPPTRNKESERRET